MRLRKLPCHEACLGDAGRYDYPSATSVRTVGVVEGPAGDRGPGFQPQLCLQLTVHRPGTPTVRLRPPLWTGGLEEPCGAKCYTVSNPQA